MYLYDVNKTICNDVYKSFCNNENMRKYSDRLKHALDIRELSQSELARQVGIKPQAIQYLCREGTRSVHSVKIAEILNINAKWLTDGVGNMEYDDYVNEIDANNNVVRLRINADANNTKQGPQIKGEVPLISWVSAGMWQEAIDNFHPGDGERMIPATVPVGAHTFALKVMGDSMEPEFMEGDIIIIEPDLEAIHTDYVIARNGNNEVTFKQLWKESGEWLLKPLNERYKIKPLGDSEIIGVVREKTKTYR